uniref:Uncharacterized protein n=1 Tax=Neisseria meningitidis alpha275 TaxID=295996 RepID=C6SN82_NEIME|nr:hypothetical protein predicted by Glimmer/Critica [Neisseria meningitidis alpha275]
MENCDKYILKKFFIAYRIEFNAEKQYQREKER